MKLSEVWEARDCTTDVARLEGTSTYVSLAHKDWQRAADEAGVEAEARESSAWMVESMSKPEASEKTSFLVPAAIAAGVGLAAAGWLLRGAL